MPNEKLDLTPAVLDLLLYAGDGEAFEIHFQDENNEAIDVSDLVWTSQIRKTRSADETDIHDLEIRTDDAATGTIVVVISAEITRALPKSSQWDIQSTKGTDDPVTILQGSVTCSPDVTRETVAP